MAETVCVCERERGGGRKGRGGGKESKRKEKSQVFNKRRKLWIVDTITSHSLFLSSMHVITAL